MPTKDVVYYTHDYVDYLDEQIDIGFLPVAKRSSGRQTIAEEMNPHGFKATIEEFDAKSIKSLGYSIYLILLFHWCYFCTGNAALIAFWCFAYCLLWRTYLPQVIWYDILAHWIFSIRQNVVAKHEATGELCRQG